MPKHDLRVLAERIRMHRARLRLSQKELGALADGASQNLVGMWEREESVPDAKQLALLAEVFDVSADHLLGFTDHPNGLPAGQYIVDLDLADNPTRGQDFAWVIPLRSKVMSAPEVEALIKERQRSKRR